MMATTTEQPEDCAGAAAPTQQQQQPSSPPPKPPPPTIAALIARAAPAGPREALAVADGDPAAALALAVHALFVEAGFRPIRGPPLALPPPLSAAPSPSASLDSGGWGGVLGGGGAGGISSKSPLPSSSSASSSSSAYAPPPGWCRRLAGAPDEWVFRYAHRGKLAPFSVHLSLQRATGRMLVRAAEEEPGSVGGGGAMAGSEAGGMGGGAGASGLAPPPTLPMMPLGGGGGGGAAAGFAPARVGGASVGPPPSHNQHMLGLQLENYFALPAAEMRRAVGWDQPGLLGPRAEPALRAMVREHLVDPLLAGAEDAPLYDEDEDGGAGGVLMGGAARARKAGAGGLGGSPWAPRVVSAVAIGVGLAAAAAAVAYAMGAQRRRAARDAFRQGRWWSWPRPSS